MLVFSAYSLYKEESLLILTSFMVAHLLVLLPQNLLDLTDLFLNDAGYLFTGAFCFQLRIIA